MKNVLILHGGGNNSKGNWFPWCKEQLEKKGYSVWVPDLPNSEYPNKKVWTKTIFSNKNWTFNSESIIVGHSAGATLILRLLENLPEGVKIKKAILVAGPATMGSKQEFFHYKENMMSGGFNWEKIKSSCEKFYLFYSDNDPYDCGIGEGKGIQNHVGGEMLFRPGEAHFNLEKGPQYNQFPEVLEKIIE